MLHRLVSSMCVFSLSAIFAVSVLWMAPAVVFAEQGQKVKVLYHVDGKDPEVAKYALALINKHIDAEGGPDKIDVELVVHGPALELFEKDAMDAEMQKRFEQIIDKGVHAEMCQVTMKTKNKTLDNLIKGFVGTLHPVAVKRIADLQQQGYLYIKP